MSAGGIAQVGMPQAVRQPLERIVEELRKINTRLDGLRADVAQNSARLENLERQLGENSRVLDASK